MTTSSRRSPSTRPVRILRKYQPDEQACVAALEALLRSRGVYPASVNVSRSDTGGGLVLDGETGNAIKSGRPGDLNKATINP